MKELADSGVLDQSLIIFTADHGLACGRHGLLGKQNMYDHSVRVPYFIAGPGVKAGRKVASPIYIQDTVPTTLQKAGAELPEHIQYQSYLPVLEGKSEGRKQIYTAYLQSAQRALIKDGYKLILYPEGKIARLYHLEKDPFEKTDLLEKGSGKEKARELFASLKEEAPKHGDSLKFGDYPALK